MRLTKNNLLPWFTEDHKDLPAWYLDSCRKFFQEIGHKQQASEAQAATKCQATSQNKND